MSNGRNGPYINAAEVSKVQGNVHRTRSPSTATFIMPSFGAAFESHPSQPSVPAHHHGRRTSLLGSPNATVLATEYHEIGGDYRRDESRTEATFDYSQATNTQVPTNYYATAAYESAGGGVHNDPYSQPSSTFRQPRAQNHDYPPAYNYGGTANYNHHPAQPAYGGNNYPAPPQTYGGHNAHPSPQPAYGGNHHSAPPQSYGNNNPYPPAHPGYGNFPPQHNQPGYAPPHFPQNGNDVYVAPMHNAPANHHGNPMSPAPHSPPASVSRSKSDMPYPGTSDRRGSKHAPARTQTQDPKIKKKLRAKDGRSKKHQGEVDEGSDEEYPPRISHRSQTL
ncbi:hypothetical protein C8F04DRAFT_228587 [Mycena alexandri]|uniref:Uncharacterized protein n=1 Tax=Mycena alexandri TaxID=1745969 RepID=A0AAD6X9Z1_9AGAR|nr:hypothetical protein C8F04DRAFT_228587 [Mycena alexandri]